MRSSRKLDKWLKVKEEAFKAIWEDRVIGYLDPGAEKFLYLLNKPTLIATISSCTGRITIVEGKWHWERGEARVIYKTHESLEKSVLESHLAKNYYEDLWLKVTGPIIHLRTPRLRCAHHIIRHARVSGFKHSGIISLNNVRGHVVEVMSGVQLMVPLKRGGKLLFNFEPLEDLISMANEALAEGRGRLETLASKVSSEPGPCDFHIPLQDPYHNHIYPWP